MIAKEPNGTYTVYGFGKPDALLEGLTFKELNSLAHEASWKVMEDDGTLDQAQKQETNR